MKFDLKDMYNYLISHTYPGALFGVEILLSLQWFFNIISKASIRCLSSRFLDHHIAA